jgi:hypothetical protein
MNKATYYNPSKRHIIIMIFGITMLMLLIRVSRAYAVSFEYIPNSGSTPKVYKICPFFAFLVLVFFS